MGTLSLLILRTLIRSELNELSTTSLTDAELNSIINDGYKDVATKALCYESKLTVSNIPASVRIVPLISLNVVRVNHVEYDLSTSCKGMMEITPQNVGYIPVSGSTPQYWFQWGNSLVIEPLPDVSTYDLFVYASCYPAAVLSADGDLLASLSVEFHECVYLFSVAFAALKLKRWTEASMRYNKYIESLQARGVEYITNGVDYRYMHELPMTVSENERSKGQ